MAVRFYLCMFLWITSRYIAWTHQDSYEPPHDRFIGCYFQAWSVFRDGEGKFSFSHIDPRLCTHLMYAFAGLHETDHTIVSRSPYGDFEQNYGLGGFKKATGLKTKFPHLKVLLTIGGWLEGSTKFSKMAASENNRRIFVDSVLNLLREHNFDGLDINWQFPGLRGGSEEDKVNFPLLLKDLKKEFDKYGLLLTALISGKKYHLGIGIDLMAVSKHLDFINLVTYDYNGPWENKTESNSPLHSNDDYNVEFSVDLLLNAGVPKQKILLGIAAYGHSFIMLSKPDQPSFGFRISNTKFKGEFTNEEGLLGFMEICKEMKKPNNSWKRYWDDLSETPILVDGLRLISYDDRESVAKKINFMMEKGLKGAFLYSLDTDDFRKTCSLPGFFGENNSAFPLLKAINVAIQDLSCGWNITVYSHGYGQDESQFIFTNK